MARLERITVTMPEEMAALMRQAVDAGEYATTSEIVREALRRWSSKRDLRKQALEQLRDLISEGATGPFRDGDEFFDQLEKETERLLGNLSDAA